MKFDIQESATAALLNLLHREKSPCTTQVCLLLKYILLSDIEDSETDSGKGRMLTACLSRRVETMASSYMVSPSNIVISIVLGHFLVPFKFVNLLYLGPKTRLTF